MGNMPSRPPGPGPMTDSIDAEIYVWCIVTAPLTTIATGLRFYATRRSGRKLNLEDWFAFGALLTHLAYCFTLIWDVLFINGRKIETIPLSQLIYIGKLTYSAIPYFPVQQLFAKFSILFLYNRLFSINKAFVRWMWFFGFLQIVYSVVTVFVSIFSCSPINGAWNPEVAVHAKCIDHNKYLAGSETINSFVDFGLVVLAVWMIRDLRIKRSLKWKLSILFILGGASGVIGFVKIGQTYNTTSPLNLESGLWTTIQQAASCICCCAPIYSSLIPRSEWFRRRFSTWSKGSRSPQKTAQGKKFQSDSSSQEKINGQFHPIDNSPPTQLTTWSDSSPSRSQAWSNVRVGSASEQTFPASAIHVKNTVEMV